MDNKSFIQSLPLFQAIALELNLSPSNRAENNFHLGIPSRNLFRFPLGILAFMANLSHFRTRNCPLAAIAAADGRFRLFWYGQYVGGLWSGAEVARAEAAAPQSMGELIQVLDRIARDSGVSERSPPSRHCD